MQGRRGESGSEIVRVILRCLLGATFIAHGVRHGRTLEGTAGWFGSIGFRRPDLQAKSSTMVEVGAGAALSRGRQRHSPHQLLWAR
jgi:putative oxidoreductase